MLKVSQNKVVTFTQQIIDKSFFKPFILNMLKQLTKIKCKAK